MEQGSLRLPDMDRSLSQVPLRLCQRHQVTARFGTPLRRLEQRLCYRQVEGLLRVQDRQAVEGGALHYRLACISCIREQ